jgi:hypothetical protein
MDGNIIIRVVVMISKSIEVGVGRWSRRRSRLRGGRVSKECKVGVGERG